MRYWLSLLIAVALALPGLVIPQPARAWGRFGHLTVCELAYRNFTPTTRAAVGGLLQSRRGGITVKGKGRMEDRHYTSFNLGCLEEDALPRQHAEDHFINVARSVGSIDGPACPGNGECILSGITRDLATLKDSNRSSEDRVRALMAIGHWVGDIHQPLHISFADDRGGNGIDATLNGRCGTSTYRVENLHAVWDNCLLESGLFERVRKRADYKKSWGRNTITYRAVDTLQANTSATVERTMVGGEPWQWAKESFATTLDPAVLYCKLINGNCQYSENEPMLRPGSAKRVQSLSQTYLAQFAPTAESRIRLAGFRLAHLINSALDPRYTQPVQDSTQAP
ncbi:MAG: S1/P1 nuclease [Sphingobium sp.]|uniref:S1/P1 nuclease n=1 Tax=Sphingobium sp. TaxID=1912891 RepID=UPI0029A7FA37|nr:S1/P1 nuclease [Sphingobium sp.]MDX3911716.1 S1/P1 nuclease [Sphingobium sp.]